MTSMHNANRNYRNQLRTKNAGIETSQSSLLFTLCNKHSALQAAIKLVALSLLIQGCKSPLSTRIDPIYPPELDQCQVIMVQAVDQMEATDPCPKKSANPVVAANKVTDKAGQAPLRNRYISQVLMAINRNYRRYKDAYYIGQAGFDTGTDFATLALAGVATVAGGVAAKAALAAAIAGITGAHATIQKNFFENNARDAVFTVMDALREKQLEAIDNSKALPMSEYSMSEALQDLDLYYEMGTVLKAQGAIYGSAANSALIPPAGVVQPTGVVPPAGAVPPTGVVPPA